jgi:carotenoid cleavage dioxygenase
MLSRRLFLHLAGSSGFSIAGAGLLGCGDAAVGAPRPRGARTALPDDPNKPWWLRQNYAPVEESEAFDLEVVGALPPALRGLYLRNGPNPQSGDSGHWFVGDGMLHGVRLEDGRAPWYRARYVQTEALGQNAEDGPIGPPGLTDHQANTAVLHHQGRVLCLEEIGVPYEVAAADLSTIGPYDFGGALQTAFTAHPKVDPVTGELLFFGYGVLDASVTLHRVDTRGVLVRSEKIPLKSAVMMHDFQVTATHVVFMDLPILFDIELAIEGSAFPFRWAPENGARIGVLPREGEAADVRWVEIDPCFVFHTWNAFHDEADPTRIHLDGVRYPTMWEKDASDFNSTGAPQRFTIDTAAETVTLTQLDDIQVEFPRIDRRRQGLPYRYGYALGTYDPDGPGKVPDLGLLVKYDHQTGARDVHELAPGQELDEALFVPDPGAKGEDEGWLLAYVFDHADNRSQLLVLDATDVAAPPVARVLLPTRVPHGFHGEFVPG